MHFTLKRISQSSEGSFGVLLEGSTPFLLTCERPWKGNAPDISCIKEGEYRCKRVDSPHFGNTFEVCDVKGRSHILFHSGNTIEDSRGCILLGTSFGKIGKTPAILSSRKGMSLFLSKTSTVDAFTLTILSVS